MKKIFWSLVFLCALAISGAFAEEIPLPADALQTNERSMDMGPLKGVFKNYTTSWDIERLKSFFKKEIPKYNWQKKERTELYFTKADKYISISIMPQKTSDKKTSFSIVYGEIPSEEAMKAGQKDKPDALDFMPVYPGAGQTYLWDSATGIIAGYKTKDKIQDVVFFYKAKMLNYGWALYNENPIVVKESTGCPECEKQLDKKSMPNIDFSKLYSKSSSSRLAFNRGSGELCIINIFGYEAVMPGTNVSVPLPDANTTQILVSYNGPKKNIP